LNRGGGIGGLLELRQGGQHYSYLYDGKGNVDGLLDDAEVMVAGYVYSPFGRLLTKTGTLDQPFCFSTKAFDEQTGLAYYGYRFYAPGVGRWINRDPIGEAGGMNLYGFVFNNPVSLVDPTGEYGLWGAVGGAVIGGIGQFGLNTWAANGDYGRAARCTNITNIAISSVVGALGPTFLKNVIRGKPGPYKELTRWPNTYLYGSLSLPAGTSAKIAIPAWRPFESANDNCEALSKELKRNIKCKYKEIKNDIGNWITEAISSW
ncbi:MAG: RHS repeat-associated core domain-containing protein, partial [Candidatus Electrothrix sp. AW3_4]|nr:RHS repeat-associated core domain-containing protein [Candidatus Electrothrix gigas]